MKAVAGGGGKGMRTVDRRRRPAERGSARRGPRPEPRSATPPCTSSAGWRGRATSRSSCSADQHGTVLPFVERECSIQRRHQKVVEESPSLAVDAGHPRRDDRARPPRSRSAAGYTNAGTIEFLLDEDGHVLLPRDEHAAAGRASDHRDGDRHRSGAVADPDRPRRAARPRSGARAHAERPRDRVPHLRRRSGQQLPAVARPRPQLRVPAGPGIRDDGGVAAGLEVPIFYDPMISKLVAWAETAPAAIARMRRALDEYRVAGIKTTVPFFTWLSSSRTSQAGRFHTTYLDRLLASRRGESFSSFGDDDERHIAIAAALAPNSNAAVNSAMASW